MKNYFEILEVDVHASDEIINRAFKVLAKRYHPDTQDEDKKQWAEEQFKLLNEAYEVLSDKSKRDEYTKKLEFDRDDKINSLLIQNADLEIQVEDLQRELDDLKNFYGANQNYSSYNSTASSNFKCNENFNKNFSQNMYNNQDLYNNNSIPNYTNTSRVYTEEPVYYESYYHPIKNKFKNLLAFLITLGVIIFIAIVIWNIPYTRSILEKLYQENSVIRMIINFFCE